MNDKNQLWIFFSTSFKTEFSEKISNALSITLMINSDSFHQPHVLLKAALLLAFTIERTNERSKNEIVTAFLAMLELNRSNKIKITQEYTYADIHIEKIKVK